MSSTFYVDGWSEQSSTEVVVFADEEHPDIDSYYFESDPSYTKNSDGRFYRTKKVYSNPFPELYMPGEVRTTLLESLGYVDYSEGSFPIEQLKEVLRKTILMINSSKKIADAEVQPYKSGIVIGCGLSSDRIKRKLNDFMALIKFAIDNNKFVYWA